MELNGMDAKQLLDQAARPELHEIGGEQRLLIPTGWTLAPRQAPPTPVPLALLTLTGLVSYLQENRDQISHLALVCHVESAGEVSLLDCLGKESELYRRREFATVNLVQGGFGFGTFHDSEAFIIGLQVYFAETPERAALLELLASIRDEKVKDTTDNGYAQSVTAKAGVALVQDLRVQNPVTLRPWRTFREVEQPASPFILRLRSGADGGKPTVALFEADGGLWKLAAVEAVAAWLKRKLPATVGVIA
jgi:hypothetical protein